jgi:hypothetical protein
VLARLSRRAERRGKLGLPAVECGGEPPTRYGCSCLERALDESGNGGRRHVLKRAAALHLSPPPPPVPAKQLPEELTPVPQEALAEPQETNEDVSEAAHDPPPQPKPTATPESPVRVVKPFPRWYDDDRRFSDMKF